MAKKSGKKRRFKGAVSRNAAKQSRGAQYGHLNLPKGVSMFKEEPKSRTDLDIMPYEVISDVHLDRDDEYEIAIPGSLWYKRPYFLHRNIGTNNDTIVCPSSVKQPCPICEYRARLLKEGANWDDDSVKALQAKQRNLYVVIPKNNKNYEEKPHIWDISQFLFQAKLNEEVQENEDFETFPDLEEGLTLRIRFSEEQMGKNTFADTSRIDFLDRKKPYTESILKDIPSLDELLNVQSYKVISSQFFGNLTADEVDDDDDDDDDRDDKVTDIPEEEEEEEEEEQEEEEEEEEEPAPAKGKKGKKGTAKGTAKAPKKNEAKCSHGHAFGKDCDEHDECGDCDDWDACMDAS